MSPGESKRKGAEASLQREFGLVRLFDREAEQLPQVQVFRFFQFSDLFHADLRRGREDKELFPRASIPLREL